MAERYIYAVAVEAFFLRAMKGRIDEATRGRIREAGIALDEPLVSVYPAELFHRCAAMACAAAYPDATAEGALHRAGRDHIDAFVQTYPGKMMAALARQIDPRTILDYTATFIRLGNNFTETRARPTGERSVEVWMNDVGGVADWYRGILERGLEVSDVKGVEVAVVPGTPPPGATFAVAWAGR